LVKEELLKLCPTLELDKQDSDLLRMCLQDAKSYMEFLHKNYTALPSKTMDVYKDGVCIGEVLNLGVDRSGMIVPDEAITEMTDYIKCFVNMWWKKWQTRVKITFDIPKGKDSFDSSNPPATPQLTNEEREELINATKDVLLRYGEVAVPDIIAISLLSQYIKHNPKKEWSVEAKLNLRTALTRQAKQMAYISGPLVFIRPNVKKINAALGEFRNDDATKIM
jgi:hypothetical protein